MLLIAGCYKSWPGLRCIPCNLRCGQSYHINLPHSVGFFVGTLITAYSSIAQKIVFLKQQTCTSRRALYRSCTFLDKGARLLGEPCDIATNLECSVLLHEPFEAQHCCRPPQIIPELCKGHIALLLQLLDEGCPIDRHRINTCPARSALSVTMPTLRSAGST